MKKHYKVPESMKVEKAQLAERIEVLRDEIKSSPVRRLLPLITRAGNYRGEIKYLTPKQYTKYFGGTARPSVVVNGKIRWEHVLDQLASEYGYKSDEDLKEAIEKLGGQVAELKRLRGEKRSIREDIATVETTKPKPEVSEFSDTPPVFDKEHDTVKAVVVEVPGLEVKRRRNPSFHQVEVDNTDTEKKPDFTFRVRYSSDAIKLSNTAIREHIGKPRRARQKHHRRSRIIRG